MMTVDDLIVYLREPPGSLDEVALEQLVRIANELVGEVVAGLSPEPARAQATRLAIATRAHYNPHGFVSEAIEAHTWPGDGGRSGVYLTDAERQELLAPAAPAAAPGPWAGSLPYRR